MDFLLTPIAHNIALISQSIKFLCEPFKLQMFDSIFRIPLPLTPHTALAITAYSNTDYPYNIAVLLNTSNNVDRRLLGVVSANKCSGSFELLVDISRECSHASQAGFAS